MVLMLSRQTKACARRSARSLSTASTSTPSSLYLRQSAPLPSASASEHFTPAQREILASAIRVDQAGEIAANWIYKGQYAILRNDKSVGPIIQEMWDQEKKHLAVMNKLQEEYRVRPTIMTEVAKVAGWGLGAATALLGKQAAMACTEAVETVIGEHYDDQLSDLDKFPNAASDPKVQQLQSLIRELRDDELEHLDTAVDHHSQRAPVHALLTAIVEAGCGVAIKICQKV